MFAKPVGIFCRWFKTSARWGLSFDSSTMVSRRKPSGQDAAWLIGADSNVNIPTFANLSLSPTWLHCAGGAPIRELLEMQRIADAGGACSEDTACVLSKRLEGHDPSIINNVCCSLRRPKIRARVRAFRAHPNQAWISKK